MEQKLASAEERLLAEPNNQDALVWVGRRLAYLSRFREAIEVYSAGFEKFGTSEFLRHRGHRWITLREFDKAQIDLADASRAIQGLKDSLEPDGIPNSKGIPVSTKHFNIWYHLGLAHYLDGNLLQAKAAYESCMEISKQNDDMLVATAHWLYMTYRRLHLLREADALLKEIGHSRSVIENDSYLKLIKLYRGDLTEEELWNVDAATRDASLGYGLGNWHLVNGRVSRAMEIFAQVVQTRHWGAFGYIAAEVDMSRLGTLIKEFSVTQANKAEMPESQPAHFLMQSLEKKRSESGSSYLEFLRVPSLNTGIYTLKAGSKDGQSPHDQDEIYYVVSGVAKFDVNGRTIDVEAGSILFVPAHAEHRFHHIEKDLTTLVIFVGQETP